MSEKYRKAVTITSEFSQTIKNATLGTTKKSSGHIWIKRPSLFRWATENPEKTLLVTDGKKVWYYSEPFREGESAQLLIRKAADVQSRLAIDLLSGSSNLEKNFKIKELKPGYYHLKPLKPAADVDFIELFLEKKTNLVYKLRLVSITGNITELQLNQVVLGQKIPDEMFKFTVPKNIPVQIMQE